MRPENQTWGFINGLRGLLALWVVAGHALNAFGTSLLEVSNPALAVDVFMIISGFLMAAHFHERAEKEPWESPRTWRRFYLRRYLRIAPAYYVALAAAFLLAARYGATHGAFDSGLIPGAAAGEPSPYAPTGRSLLLHLTFLFGLSTHYAASVICIPDWSISLEMQFYAAFPFLMLMLRRWGVVLLVVVTLVLDKVAHHYWGVYAGSAGILGVFPQPSFLPLKLSWFVVGILIADSVHQRECQASAAAALSAGLALFLGHRGHSLTLLVITFGFILLAHRTFVTGALGIAARPVGLVDQALGSRLGTFLADCSYAIYLIHYFILYPFALAVRSNASLSALAPMVQAAIVFVGTVALTIPLAYALHRWVEQPGINLGRKLLRSRP